MKAVRKIYIENVAVFDLFPENNKHPNGKIETEVNRYTLVDEKAQKY